MISFCYLSICVHLYNYFSVILSKLCHNMHDVMSVRTTMEISACTLLCYLYILKILLYRPTHVINMYAQNTLFYASEAEWLGVGNLAHV